MSHNIQSSGVCTSCENSKTSNSLHTGVVGIGSPVAIEEKVGRGHSRIEHSFFQCHECGSVWVELLDRGAFGRDRHLRRLTEGLF
jgi:hypothetical protein